MTSCSFVPPAPTARNYHYCYRCRLAQPFAHKDANFVEPKLPPIGDYDLALVRYFSPTRFVLHTKYQFQRDLFVKDLQPLQPGEKDHWITIFAEMDSPNVLYIRDNYVPEDTNSYDVVYRRQTPVDKTSEYCTGCYAGLMNETLELARIRRRWAAEEEERNARMSTVN